MTAFLKILWGILFETAPYILLGMLAAGLMAETFTRFRKIRSFISRKSFISLSFFNLFGFIMPICSCGTIPMAVGFRAHGVPFGNIYAFIFTAPATSIAAVIFSTALLGWQFTIFYIGGAIIAGYLIGVTFYLLDNLKWWKNPVIKTNRVCYNDTVLKNKDSFLIRSLKKGVLVYGSEISIDMVVGLSLTSLLLATYTLPNLTSWFDNLPYYQAAILMIALALPMYVCSLPGILMGATLVMAGLKPELLWVFLMSGPITNLGDMNVLRRQVGFETTIVYMAIVISVTLLWGMVIKHYVDPDQLWFYVRGYLSTYPSIVAGTLTVTESPVRQTGFALKEILNFTSAILFIGLIAYGTVKKIKTVWENPCLHCRHYQMNIELSTRSCRIQCWKKLMVRIIKIVIPKATVR